MEYTYRRTAQGGFVETRSAVECAAPRHGFQIRHVHDLQAALSAKGFPIQPLCVYELWLTDDEYFDGPEAMALLPCRLHVYMEGGEVRVAAIRPTLSSLMFPELEFDGADVRLEKAVTALVDECAGAQVT